MIRMVCTSLMGLPLPQTSLRRLATRCPSDEFAKVFWFFFSKKNKKKNFFLKKEAKTFVHLACATRRQPLPLALTRL
ncbi:MAG: hypothetical protein WDN04_11090 [Rhodospirillales bacterium]